MTRYYVNIDGKKYDRALLEAAAAAVAKPGDGRISVADADTLADLVLDGKPGDKNYTAIERETVAHIRATSKWTGAADRRFLARIPDAPALKPWQFAGGGAPAAANYAPIVEVARPLLAAHGIAGLAVQIDADEVAAQQQAFAGTVSFAQALDAALGSFLHDGERADSPLMMASEIVAGEGQLNGFSDPEQAVQDLLNRGTSTLRLVSREDMVRAPGGSAERVFPPEEGEPIEANWLFALQLESAAVLHWAIVDRNGTKPTYNYGFN